MCAVVLWTKIVVECMFLQVGSGEDRQKKYDLMMRVAASRLNVSASNSLLCEIVCRSGFASTCSSLNAQFK